MPYIFVSIPGSTVVNAPSNGVANGNGHRESESSRDEAYPKFESKDEDTELLPTRQPGAFPNVHSSTTEEVSPWVWP